MQKIFFFLFLVICLSYSLAGQAPSSKPSSGFRIGGYAQIDYNQPLGKGIKTNGVLDIHRLVTTMTYQFNAKTKFVSEVEFEHVKEVAIEQAFLTYRLNRSINLKAGLVLIPMGLINLYHEPPSFNGVERPNLDKYIVPTTWREIGIGLTGNIQEMNIHYQLYLVNGFRSYANGQGMLRGVDGLRKGRQKGAESIVASPNISTRIDYYGLPNLKVGLSIYLGKTQSDLTNGISKTDKIAQSRADSSIIGISMLALDARYTIKKLMVKGQFIASKLQNTAAYNAFTQKDLGAGLMGYYLEVAYNVLPKKQQTKLYPFIRYERYNTHQKVDEGIDVNPEYNRQEITMGLTWKIADGAVWKADYQFIKSKITPKFNYQLNLGVGVNF